MWCICSRRTLVAANNSSAVNNISNIRAFAVCQSNCNNIIVCFCFVFYGLCLWAFRGRLYKLGEAQALSNSIRYLSLTEAFGALKEILFKSRQSLFVDKFRFYSENFMSTKVTANLVSVMPRYVLEGAVFAGLIFFVIVFVSDGGDVITVMPLVAAFTMAVTTNASYATNLRCSCDVSKCLGFN